MERLWACVKDGRVARVIVANQDFVDSIASKWQAIVEVFKDSMPTLGDTYAEGVFGPPPTDKTTEQLAKEAEKQAATDALKQLKIDSKDKDLSAKEMSDAIKQILSYLGL